ncbi:hypothetical protein [Caulobacter mirabilis]|nr:hypothetical protein [Caulobacter mirabilis]
MTSVRKSSRIIRPA